MLSQDQIKRITKRHSFFKSTTFASKLFLKLTRSQVNPLISAISVLKFEPSNRTKKDIEQTLPFLVSLKPFHHFITYKENISNYEQIFIHFAMVLYYQYIKPNFLFKKLGEKLHYFYLIITGTVTELQLTFTKEYLTDEEYLTHLIKLTLLNETYVVSRIMLINKNIFNFNNETLHHYISTNTKYNYNDLCAKAHKSLLNCGINSSNYKRILPTIEAYLNVFKCEKNPNCLHDNKKCFLIGMFVNTKTLTSGDYIGDLLPYNNITKKISHDNYAYIANEATDIGYVDKKEYANEEIFKIIIKRMQRIFNAIHKTYYILQNIPTYTFTSTYSQLITYKQIKKGEKLFIQNSPYNGVYLLSYGEYEVYTYRSYDELDSLMVVLQTSLDNFNECISPLQHERLPMERVSDIMNNKLYQNVEFLKESRDKRKITFCKYNNREVVGLNEYYNSKNNLYNFTVECVSDDGFYYYINKECFSYMINRERMLKESVMQLVELKVKYFIGSINKYKQTFARSINSYNNCGSSVSGNNNKEGVLIERMMCKPKVNLCLNLTDNNTYMSRSSNWKKERNTIEYDSSSNNNNNINEMRRTYGMIKLIKTPMYDSGNSSVRENFFRRERKGMLNEYINVNDTFGKYCRMTTTTNNSNSNNTLNKYMLFNVTTTSNNNNNNRNSSSSNSFCKRTSISVRKHFSNGYSGCIARLYNRNSNNNLPKVCTSVNKYKEIK